MKVFVLHDDSGTIRGTVVAKVTALRAGVNPSANLKVMTLTTDKKKDDDLADFLQDLHANHRVALGHDEPKIVRKKTISSTSAQRS